MGERSSPLSTVFAGARAEGTNGATAADVPPLLFRSELSADQSDRLGDCEKDAVVDDDGDENKNRETITNGCISGGAA